MANSITLTTLADGAVCEMFDKELMKVIANIEDERADWKKPRRISLEVTFLPNLARRIGDIAVSCTSELSEQMLYLRVERIAEEIYR